MGCPLLNLPGELRNRIYNYTVEENTIKLGKKQEPLKSRLATNRQFFSLTQVCRSIRSEFSPLYRARTWVSLIPQDLYDYIGTFLAQPGVTGDEMVGLITLDLAAQPHTTACIDMKPLLQLLRRAVNLHVGTPDITNPPFVPGLRPGIENREPSIQNILVDLYDIYDMCMFHEYMNEAMTALELECDDAKGVEVVFELGPEHWEVWMGEWSKPDHDPDYRIPIELEDKVVRWGMQCGMELDQSMGSHLTVNFRRGR
ncbi:hypothetical protein ST47_g9967 [Ascochyta rabiei]|uniref:F-box domain-containing protein n=1 Tax=Didymella rabiei TaxID=5454 RepID=A0A162W8Z6_DIDRA|nr:hypothetical protein ST47_g9967 [Ascochyta rabiei]